MIQILSLIVIEIIAATTEDRVTVGCDWNIVGRVQRRHSVDQSDDAPGFRGRRAGASVALQADHSMYRDAASCASLLVSTRFDDDHPSLVPFPLLSFPVFSVASWARRRRI